MCRLKVDHQLTDSCSATVHWLDLPFGGFAPCSAACVMYDYGKLSDKLLVVNMPQANQMLSDLQLQLGSGLSNCCPGV